MPLPDPGHRRVRVSPTGLPPSGIYELIVDRKLRQLLDGARNRGIAIEERSLGAGDLRLLGRELSVLLAEALEQRLSANSEISESDLAFLNQLLATIAAKRKSAERDDEELLPAVLRSVGNVRDLRPPDIADHGLLTGREGSENLLLQIRRELATCDKADWLVSFIKLLAVKMLERDIEDFLARGGELRIVTTAYMGATQPEALERLAEISRSNRQRLKIRFSKESGTTRLHAKSYIHHRSSGFGAAYIGSANLSRPALTDGLEWTVRLAQYASPGLWSKITETFEQWWGDPEFTEFGIEKDHPSHEAFRRLVQRERGDSEYPLTSDQLSIPIFDLQPKPFQQAILERIQVERAELGHNRHLIVAATGTGKTMIAAFDYRDYRRHMIERSSSEPRMLYLAHSERILKQARVTFAQVLGDRNFGGFLVGERDDRVSTALFASIQSWHSKRLYEQIQPDYFDYVVVDEVHHGEADSWRRFLEWIKPRSLIGLTATPERTDGKDIRVHFGGRTTAELRLGEAISRRLLVPFSYFGVADDIDLRNVAWTGRGYDRDALETAYVTAGPMWVEGVRKAICDYVADPRKMRAIGFCCGVAHAAMLARAFNDARDSRSERSGSAIRAEVIHGGDDDAKREAVIGKLRRGELQIIFVADLLNEGVDIPEADTVLFLRPTTSLTVFIQQLGRGLRLCDRTGKDCLTVLDFVGQHRREFKHARRLGALTVSGQEIRKSDVALGGWELPPGCSITLEQKAQERVLESIASSTTSKHDQILEGIREMIGATGAEPTLREFCEHFQVPPTCAYQKPGWNWLALVSQARLGDRASLPNVPAKASAGLRSLASTDDIKFANFALNAVRSGPNPDGDGVLYADRRLAMFLAEVDGLHAEAGSSKRKSLKAKLRVLRADRDFCDELFQLLSAVGSQTLNIAPEQVVALPRDVPLRVHRSYSRKQVLAAFGWKHVWTAAHQKGVEWFSEYQALLMFVTLRKDNASFTDRTRFRDFAISPTEFHWESQRATGEKGAQRRQIELAREGKATMWLFIRDERENAHGTAPFTFMGRFKPQSIEGANPVRVTGFLDDPMPGHWFELAARAR